GMGDHETAPAVEEGKPEDVILEEGERKHEGRLPHPHRFALVQPVPALQFGVAQHLELLVHQGRIVGVVEGRAQGWRGAVEAQRFMYARIAPARPTAVIQPRQLFAHGRSVPAHRPAHVDRAAAQPGGGRVARHQRGQALLQFAGELGAEVFVGVQHQDPVMAALAAGKVALRAEAKPILVHHARAVCPRDRHGVVVAARIDHQLFGRERDAVQAARNRVGLVVGDDGEGQREGGHGRILAEACGPPGVELSSGHGTNADAGVDRTGCHTQRLSQGTSHGRQVSGDLPDERLEWPSASKTSGLDGLAERDRALDVSACGWRSRQQQSARIVSPGQPMRISVAVITYNWPEALELVLRALASQTELPYEVIVTDDGSQPATRELLLRLARDYPVRLVHLWQPDDGARMSRARNRAIAAARGDYVILLDGDMVAERHFIADHRAFARRGCFAQGSRVLTDASSVKDMLGRGPSFPEFFRRGIDRRRHTLRLPLLARLFARPSTRQRGIKSCNMAFWRDDLLRLNGFNETM